MPEIEIGKLVFFAYLVDVSGREIVAVAVCPSGVPTTLITNHLLFKHLQLFKIFKATMPRLCFDLNNRSDHQLILALLSWAKEANYTPEREDLAVSFVKNY